MLTDEQKDLLVSASREFRGFDDIVSAILPQQPDDDDVAEPVEAAPVDAVLLLKNLSDEHGGSLKKDMEDLAEASSNGSLSKAQQRLTAARMIARWKLNNPDKGEGVSEHAQEALKALVETDRLRASAIDVLASAILLPEGRFTKACFATNHASGALAGQFDVPLGVVTLRQRVLTDANS